MVSKRPMSIKLVVAMLASLIAIGPGNVSTAIEWGLPRPGLGGGTPCANAANAWAPCLGNNAWQQTGGDGYPCNILCSNEVWTFIGGNCTGGAAASAVAPFNCKSCPATPGQYTITIQSRPWAWWQYAACPGAAAACAVGNVACGAACAAFTGPAIVPCLYLCLGAGGAACMCAFTYACSNCEITGVDSPPGSNVGRCD